MTATVPAAAAAAAQRSPLPLPEPEPPVVVGVALSALEAAAKLAAKVAKRSTRKPWRGAVRLSLRPDVLEVTARGDWSTSPGLPGATVAVRVDVDAEGPSTSDPGAARGVAVDAAALLTACRSFDRSAVGGNSALVSWAPGDVDRHGAAAVDGAFLLVMAGADRLAVPIYSGKPDRAPQRLAEPAAAWLGAVDVDGRALAEGLQRCRRAACDEPSRYALGGVMIDPREPARRGVAVDGSGVCLVATDGRRLHRVAVDVDQATPADEAAAFVGPVGAGGERDESKRWPILPLGAVDLVREVAKRGDVVTIARAGAQLALSAPGVLVVCDPPPGAFPRWREIIPARTTETVVSGVAGDWLAAFQRMAKQVTPERAGVDVTHDGAATDRTHVGSLVVRTDAGGETRAPAVLEQLGDGGPDITLAPRFLVDWLRDLPQRARVELRVVDADAAAVLRCNEAGALAVVMPLARDRR